MRIVFMILIFLNKFAKICVVLALKSLFLYQSLQDKCIKDT